MSTHAAVRSGSVPVGVSDIARAARSPSVPVTVSDFAAAAPAIARRNINYPFRTFEKLPPELRNKVYKFCARRWRGFGNLALVNRQVSNDYLAVRNARVHTDVDWPATYELERYLDDDDLQRLKVGRHITIWRHGRGNTNVRRVGKFLRDQCFPPNAQPGEYRLVEVNWWHDMPPAQLTAAVQQEKVESLHRNTRRRGFLVTADRHWVVADGQNCRLFVRFRLEKV